MPKYKNSSECIYSMHQWAKKLSTVAKMLSSSMLQKTEFETLSFKNIKNK